MRDPVLRNLEISQCYSLLASAAAARTGEGANWCTYATWASRQAGRTIRGEDMIERLRLRLGKRRWLLHPVATLWRRLLRRGLFQGESRLGRLTAALHTPFDAFERASDAVARGNLKVFEEIGLEFARHLNETSTAPALERFLASLRRGDPPEGQRYLLQAFQRYVRLEHEDDPKVRTELAFLANLEIGFHEQSRLQPEIREALDAGTATGVDLGRRALEALVPSARRWWPIGRRPAAALVGAVAGALQRASSRVAREVVTDALMTLSLPGRVLWLGSHLDEPFPDTLREPAEPELVELLARFEPADGDADDCGARDWAVLDQRMHYIAHLFRAFHVRPELTGAPFTDEQLRSIRGGVVPDGEL
jgi:hypothetical protein